MDIKKTMHILLQYLIPQHALSRVCSRVANTKNRYIKQALINWFVRTYDVDLTTARITDTQQFSSFNDFFTRELAPGARPLPEDPALVVSPADAVVSEFGTIVDGSLIQAKGRAYSLEALLTPQCVGRDQFIQGEFITLYLSPRDYHRVHMPYTGRLRQMIYVPGDLFSVNQSTAEGVEGLFARNERVICSFDTDKGPMMVILVGAMIVAGIHTVWHGPVAPCAERAIRVYDYTLQDIDLHTGDELGHFELGSTVIVLMGHHAIAWDPSVAHRAWLPMGHPLSVSSPIKGDHHAP